MRSVHIDNQLGAAVCFDFNELYPHLNNDITNSGNVVESRNGQTLEFLDFKTKILSPTHRCVGVKDRDVNIFFLLAEALWIWRGEKDVEFLAIFNSRMADYSDDGKNFHAPYGFRLRNWGTDSRTVFTEENKHASAGKDQILSTLLLLKKEEETRRAVMSIWNPDLDLNVDGKDLPCNDLVMLQERNGQLNMTISNRSNDLHWGLPTNVFQFSWILEIMAWCLGLKVGTQTHNSKSLHIYTDNEIANKMNTSRSTWKIYDVCAPSKFDIQGPQNLDPVANLIKVDFLSNSIIKSLRKQDSDGEGYEMEFNYPFAMSYLTMVHHILSIYVGYKTGDKTDERRMEALRLLSKLDTFGLCADYLILAKNWFFKRIKDNVNKLEITQELTLPEYIGKL